MRFRFKAIELTLVLLVIASLLPGCQRRSGQIETAPEYDLKLEVQPSPAMMGSAELMVELSGPDGQPVDGAELSVRGDMTHPGMTPVLADMVALGDGRYQADLEWTMAGDWIITFEVTLPDGLRFERTFDLTVAGAMDHDS